MTELADVIKELRAWLEWLKKRGHTHMSIPIAEMHTWLEAAEKAERYEKALHKLACLGNGDMFGTSVGNMIAREALNPEGETK